MIFHSSEPFLVPPRGALWKGKEKKMYKCLLKQAEKTYGKGSEEVLKLLM